MEELYRKNENETNEFVTKAIRLMLVFVLIIGALCKLNIFDVSDYIIDGFIFASLLPLILPTVLVDILHIYNRCIKYILILCVVITTGIAYVVFTYQALIIFIVPSILATFYLDKRVMLFTGISTVINIAISHFITGFYLFQPWIEPFTDIKLIMLYGALPRVLQYTFCLILLYILSKRYSKFISSLYSVMGEEVKFDRKDDKSTYLKSESEIDELDKVIGLLTEREKDVFKLLVTGHTNAQIANILYISHGTVKNYVSIIYDKIGERDRTALVLKYSSYYRDCDLSHI